MKFAPFLCFAASLGIGAFLLSPQAQADDQPSFAGKSIDELNGDDVLELVRYSYTLYDQDFTGQLRQGFRDRTPFVLRLKPESIQFIFDDPAQLIYIDTENKRFALFEGVGGSPKTPVNPSKYGQNIRGTDVTYDDLSMRFLHWPNARIAAEERLKNRDVWVVAMRNPDGHGDYETVNVWIDKKSGALMKMIGYTAKGRPVRVFEVLHGKKFGNVWMVSDMRIETIDPATGKIISTTRMQLKDTVKP